MKVCCFGFVQPQQREAGPDRPWRGVYCGLNMGGSRFAMLRRFVGQVFQLRGDELDAGGLFNCFGFNLAGAVIAQLSSGHFDYRIGWPLTAGFVRSS